jgi:hypothetical protein
MQDIHERIAASNDLSKRAKLILLLIIFILYGRYTIFTVIWEWDTPLPDSHIRLRSGRHERSSNTQMYQYIVSLRAT